MAILQLIIHNFFSFVFIISLIVFIHEFGHFYVARLCGVKVEEFSLGFGRELFGFVDKKKTRWKFCLLPFGGYVKMFGDRNGASVPDEELLQKMSVEDRKQSFLGKNVYQRIAIVAAGPIANFILAIVIFTFLFKVNGLNSILPVIDTVIPESAAYEAKLQKGDKILAVNNNEIAEFNELRMLVTSSADKELLFTIEREKRVFDIKITPKRQDRKDFFGDEVKMGTLGVTASEVIHSDLNLYNSFIEANVQTYKTSMAIFKALGELITGKRSVEELGGPIKIAKYSGKTMDMGLNAVIWFMAMISINLGVMNLLPIPVLDGGHLFFYSIEAIFRKPLSLKVQKVGFQIGMSLIITLMMFTTFNDIRQLIQ